MADMPHKRKRRVSLDRVNGGLLVALPILLGAVGCSSSTSEEIAREPIQFSVLVQNMNLRTVGESCAGTGPYTYVHAKSQYRIEDGSGSIVAEGLLPSGKAVPASDIEWGVERVPTFCQFDFTAHAAAGNGQYRLIVEDRKPAPFSLQADGTAKIALS